MSGQTTQFEAGQKLNSCKSSHLSSLILTICSSYHIKKRKCYKRNSTMSLNWVHSWNHVLASELWCSSDWWALSVPVLNSGMSFSVATDICIFQQQQQQPLAVPRKYYSKTTNYCNNSEFEITFCLKRNPTLSFSPPPSPFPSHLQRTNFTVTVKGRGMQLRKRVKPKSISSTPMSWNLP